jgi:TRAP-type C4-dicarboxylate transport system permease small subunit
MIRSGLDRLYLMCGWVAAGFIVAICTMVSAQVSLNLIDRLAILITGDAIGLAIASYSDFTGFFLSAASFFALAHTFRDGGHIRVSIILQVLPPAGRRAADILCLTLTAAVAVYFTYYAAALTFDSYSYNDLSSGLVAVPIWIPQLSTPLGLVILSIAVIDDLIKVLFGFAPSFSGKGENLLEEIEEPVAWLDGSGNDGKR